jgi:GDSL-like Lipase/Acylhydrolase family
MFAARNSTFSHKPIITELALMGSSTISESINKDSESLSAFSFPIHSFVHWLYAELDQKIMAPYNPFRDSHEFGESGASSDNILAMQVPRAVALRPQSILVLLGLNDLTTGVIDATIVSNSRSIVRTMQAAGIQVIACLITPKSLDVTYASRIDTTNALLATMYAEEGVRYFDPLPFVADPVTRYWLTNYSRDNTHQSQYGAMVFARELAKWLRANFNFPLDKFATIRGSSLKGGNTKFTGAGILGDGWVLTQTSGTAVASKLAASDGLGDWQRIVFTPSNWAHDFSLTYPATTLASLGINPRDTVRLWAEVDVVGGASTEKIYGRLLFNGATSIRQKVGFGMTFSSIPQAQGTAVVPTHGVYVSPYFTVPSDATTVTTLFQANGTGDFRIRDFGIEVVETARTFVSGDRMIIDIGAFNSPETSGQAVYYNNHTLGVALGRYHYTAIKTTTPSSTGTQTPAKLLTRGAGGVWGISPDDAGQNGYLNTNDGNTTDTAYAGSAKRDYGAGYNTGGRDPMPSRIYHLDPSKTYKFTFFASSNTANSKTRYTVTGSNSGTADLDCRPAGVPNSTDVAVITGITPTAQGSVVISTTSAPSGASNGQHCLGIIDIEVE